MAKMIGAGCLRVAASYSRDIREPAEGPERIRDGPGAICRALINACRQRPGPSSEKRPPSNLMFMGTVMNAIDRRKEIILERELDFANAIGSAVVEKPRVSFWMIMIPLLFIYFIYRMKKYKDGRLKFDEEFMAARRRAMEAALEAVETGAAPDIERAVRQSDLADTIAESYASWIRVQVEYYMDLLSAPGESFETLVRSAYHSLTSYLLALNRLNTVEKEFYAALKPLLAATEGAAEIITTIEIQSQHLRRRFAEQIFA